MKTGEEYRYTGNLGVYNMARKWYLADVGDIFCSYCRYHKGENLMIYDNRSWKRYRKTQYKPIDMG